MVKITEEEFTDWNGQPTKVRRIEAARARLTRPDGTVEEYSDCSAQEEHYSLPDKPPQWRLFGIPVTVFLRTLGTAVSIESIRLLAENGDTILKLVGMIMAAERSLGGRDYLMGTEAPLEDEDANC